MICIYSIYSMFHISLWSILRCITLYYIMIYYNILYCASLYYTIILFEMMISVVDDAVTWHTQTKKILLKIFFPPKEKVSFTIPLMKNFFSNEKNFQTYLKKTIFYSKKKCLVFTRKKVTKENIPKKKLLYLSEKLISYTYLKKLKIFISDVFWIWPFHLLCQQKSTN